MMNIKYWIKHPGYFLQTFKGLFKNRDYFVYRIYTACGIRPGDKLAIRIAYYNATGKKLNLKHPVTFNEKLNYLKLSQRNPIMTDLVDKVKAKELLSSIIGTEYIIPTLGVWERFDDIDFSTLPDRFVLKTNHDSGTVCVCRSKATFDYAAAKEKLTKSLAYNYYEGLREWPYKNIERKILAEEYLEQRTTDYGNPPEGFVMINCDENGPTDSKIKKNPSAKGVINLLKEIRKLYPLFQPEIYADSNGNIITKCKLNTPPPHYKFSQFSDIIDLCSFWEVHYKDADALTLTKGNTTIHFSHNPDYEEINDYKVFCFNGEVKLIKVDFDRSSGHKANYYTPDWQLLPFEEVVVPHDASRFFPKPVNLEKIIELAVKISNSKKLADKPFPLVRIDFYIINNRVYIGEITFFHMGGISDFKPDEWNNTIGSWIHLSTDL